MSLLRRAVERLSRRVVLTRRLPAAYGGGSLYVSPDASLKLWRRNFRATVPELFRWVDQLVEPGFTIWDIGGNAGIFAFAAAGSAGNLGHVCVVEPDIELARLLARTARIQPGASAPVDVIPLAVSDRVSLAAFNVAQRGRATNHLTAIPAGSQAGGVRECRSVITVTLDWLLDILPMPDVLKIDVEGAEAAVLRGGARLLEVGQPLVVVEVAERNRKEVTASLQSAGYHLFDGSRGDLRTNEPLDLAAWDTIAVPVDRWPR